MTETRSRDLDRVARPPALGTVATLVLIGGVFLPVLSFFVVNVALPGIGQGLGASAAGLQLVVGSYGIANAALVVLGGRLGDAHGRRRLFLLGMAGFTVAALVCGVAPNLTVLLTARVLQGALAALMTPQVLSTIGATLEGDSRTRAIGLFSASGGVAAALGQVLGGVLVGADLFGWGWRSVFLVFVPVGLASLVAAWRLIPETRASERLPLDALGAVILGTTLVLLLLPLTEGRPLGWPLWTTLTLVATIPAALLLITHQRRRERRGGAALVSPRVVALPAMRLGLLTAVCYFTTFGGFMFVFALATQGDAHLTPLMGGLTLLPLAAAFMVVSASFPRIERRWGSRTLVAGWAIQLVGYAALAGVVAEVWPHVTPLNLALPMAVAGTGGALVMTPLFGLVLSQVPPEQAGLGSGILITAQQTCLSLGAALVGTVYLVLAAGQGSGPALVVVCLVVSAVSLVGIPLALRLGRVGSGTPARR